MKKQFFQAIFAAFVVLVSSVSAQDAHARAHVRDGFSFEQRGDVKIVVFRPDVHVGSLKVGGLDEPNADWTATARANIQSAMESNAQARSARLEFLDDLEGENAELLNGYRGLFEAVSASMFQHIALGDRLPTKTGSVTTSSGKQRKYNKLDWTLGPETVRLREATGADYAMFVYTHDSYGDAGRKVAQVLMAGLFGAYMPAGVHIGYSGLVDLHNGDIVWFNTDLAMGGDPRKREGAEKRVGQLLEGFPQHNPSPLAGATAVQDAAADEAVTEDVVPEAEAVAESESEIETGAEESTAESEDPVEEAEGDGDSASESDEAEPAVS